MEPDISQEKKSETLDSITNRPDGWLVREWKSGNEQAAGVLFDRYAIRLVALVASRLNRRFQHSIDPRDIVQSALGSFFDAARQSRIQVSASVSLWRLLATFARRKMTRSIERRSAIKRGGDQIRLSLEPVLSQIASNDTSDPNDDAEVLVATLKAKLPNHLFVIVEGMLAGHTHRALADSLGIDERTVRRRLSKVRELLGHDEAKAGTAAVASTSQPALPRVNYSEFVLGNLIGSGGFGKVYRASMQVEGLTVAVKFLRKAFWENEGARESFLREINIASQINHPGVIRYLGYGESPHGGPYIISEWIDGRSLQDVSNVTTSLAIDWLRQICEAIQVVHRAGLIHGDLTPSNILVDKQGRIAITDFGFSQASSGSSPPVLGGTLGFAAPEQIDPAFGSIGPCTDLYAIGGLLYWLLLGQPPNAGQSSQEALATTLSHIEPNASGFGTIPEPLRRILVRTLRRSPADRQMSLAGILLALSEAKTDVLKRDRD